MQILVALFVSFGDLCDGPHALRATRPTRAVIVVDCVLLACLQRPAGASCRGGCPAGRVPTPLLRPALAPSATLLPPARFDQLRPGTRPFVGALAAGRALRIGPATNGSHVLVGLTLDCVLSSGWPARRANGPTFGVTRLTIGLT